MFLKLIEKYQLIVIDNIILSKFKDNSQSQTILTGKVVGVFNVGYIFREHI